MLQYKKDLFYGEKWTEEGRELKGWKKEIMEVEVTVQFSCSVVSNSVTEWTAAHQLLRCQESLKGCSGLVHWDDPEGWMGREVRGEFTMGKHMYTHGGFKSMYGKTNTIL